jgi:hypothetical protein
MANIIDALNLDECTDYSLFEQANDDLRTMRAIRMKLTVAEEAKPNPDRVLIAQWEADLDRLRDENESLKIGERARNIEIIMKYNPEIRAWYGADEKVAHVA